MIETELKILEINVAQVTKKLLALGAKKVGVFKVVADHFDFPDRRIKQGKKLLRLRRVGEKVEFCFKKKAKKNSQFKIAEEIETEVGDFKTMKNILLELGLTVSRRHEKTRTSFVLEKLKFEIDRHKNIPPYLEIEGSIKDIKAILPRLGYSFKDTTNMNMGEVLRLYQVKES